MLSESKHFDLSCLEDVEAMLHSVPSVELQYFVEAKDEEMAEEVLSVTLKLNRLERTFGAFEYLVKDVSSRRSSWKIGTDGRAYSHTRRMREDGLAVELTPVCKYNVRELPWCLFTPVCKHNIREFAWCLFTPVCTYNVRELVWCLFAGVYEINACAELMPTCDATWMLHVRSVYRVFLAISNISHALRGDVQ